jgi:hypothetical protein
MVVIDGKALAVGLGIYPANGALAVLSYKERVIVNGSNHLALCVAAFVALIPATIGSADIAGEFVILLHPGTTSALLGLDH